MKQSTAKNEMLAARAANSDWSGGVVHEDVDARNNAVAVERDGSDSALCSIDQALVCCQVLQKHDSCADCNLWKRVECAVRLQSLGGSGHIRSIVGEQGSCVEVRLDGDGMDGAAGASRVACAWRDLWQKMFKRPCVPSSNL
jgi:hypothetical protein